MLVAEEAGLGHICRGVLWHQPPMWKEPLGESTQPIFNTSVLGKRNMHCVDQLIQRASIRPFPITTPIPPKQLLFLLFNSRSPICFALCPFCDPFQALKHGYLKKGQISSKGFTTPHLPCRRIGFLQLLFVNLFLVGLGSPGILFFAPPSQSLFEEFPECFSPGLSRPFPSQASQRNDPGLMNFGPGSIIT